MAVKILVTGASGAVGSEVTKLLCERGVPATAVVRSPEKAAGVAAHCVAVRVAELDKAAEVDALFEGVDKVFLVTPATTDQLELGDRMIAAADAAGVNHIVKLGITGAVDERGMLLGRWNRHMEKLIERSGMRWTFLRAGSFMQNYAGAWGHEIGTLGRIALPAGDGASSLIDARDVATAGVEALLGDGHADRAYELTGEVAHSNGELAELFTHVLGRPVEYADVPVETAREGLMTAGVPEPLLTATLELWDLQRRGGLADVSGDFADITGRQPRSFAQFIRDYGAAWGVGDDVQLGSAGLDG